MKAKRTKKRAKRASRLDRAHTIALNLVMRELRNVPPQLGRPDQAVWVARRAWAIALAAVDELERLANGAK